MLSLTRDETSKKCTGSMTCTTHLQSTCTIISRDDILLLHPRRQLDIKIQIQ